MDLSTRYLGQALSLLTVSIASYLIITVVYRVFWHPLHKVPGPRIAAATGLWRTRKYFQGIWHDDVVNLHEQYGSVVRIAPDEISFVDEAALKTVFGHGQPSIKTKWYNTWQFNPMPGLFPTTDPKVHRFLRGRVSSAYSMSAILRMEPFMCEVLHTALNSLDYLARSRQPVKLDDWVSYYAFDVVGAIGFGKPFGFSAAGKDTLGIVEAIHSAFFVCSNFGHLPGQNIWIASPLLETLSRTFPALNPMTRFSDFAREQVRTRMRDNFHGDRSDMLQHFVAMKDKDGNPVNEFDVLNETGSLLGAGADTTTGAILFVFCELIPRPQLYKEVQREVDAAHSALGLGPSEELTYLQASKLPLLGAVIQEATRLSPSIPYQLLRETPPDGMSIGTYYIPRGTMVGISAAAMNRSQSIFGPDAAEFRPGRWLASDDSKEEEARVRAMEAKLTTFGMGSRGCIGKNFALVELHTYIAAFLRRFNAELADRRNPWKVHSQWFSLPKDFNVLLEARNDAGKV